jgi:hypothetical protein
MIRRMINIALAGVAYTCIGTVISQIIIFLYLSSAWNIDHQRVEKILAAAQGIEPISPKEIKEEVKKPEVKAPEEPSYDQIVEARARKYRNLEIREQELRDNLAQVQHEQNQLTDEKKRYKKLRDGFDSQLLAVNESATSAGNDEVRRTLESIKPKQAKALLLDMLGDNEIDNVVTLLSAMPDGKRAKIIGEFKTSDEMNKLSEVLRRIREGVPTAETADKTRKQLDQLKQTQL